MGNAHDANIRIGSVERERAVTALAEHLSEGRLEVTEYDQRCALATAARTRGELDAIFSDLPAPHPNFGGAETSASGPARTNQDDPVAPLVERAPAKNQTKAAIIGLAVFAVVTVVAVVALTQTWWAFIPVLVIVVLFAMFA